MHLITMFNPPHFPDYFLVLTFVLLAYFIVYPYLHILCFYFTVLCCYISLFLYPLAYFCDYTING